MKLTFYCHPCIQQGRTNTIRWSNLIHFLNHFDLHPRRPRHKTDAKA